MKPIPRDPAYLGALVYFDRVAHHMSFSKAAEELGVTPSAVSHRIKKLEEALGHRLLDRSPHAITLTREGLRMADATGDAMSGIAAATREVLARKTLRISIGPYLSTAWLMPHLSDFEAQFQGLRVDLLHMIGMPDLRDADLAIIWTEKSLAEMGGRLLFSPETVPVAAPGKLDNDALWQQTLPLIHYRSREAWRHWLKDVGGPESFALTGEVFEDPNLVLEAAAHGRGIALGFYPFITSHLQSGRLVPAHSKAVPSHSAYWLVPGGRNNPASRDFIEWLMKQAGGTCGSCHFP